MPYAGAQEDLRMSPGSVLFDHDIPVSDEARLVVIGVAMERGHGPQRRVWKIQAFGAIGVRESH